MITLSVLLALLSLVFFIVLIVILSGGVTGLAIVLDIFIAAFILGLFIKLITGKKK